MVLQDAMELPPLDLALSKTFLKCNSAKCARHQFECHFHRWDHGGLRRNYALHTDQDLVGTLAQHSRGGQLVEIEGERREKNCNSGTRGVNSQCFNTLTKCEKQDSLLQPRRVFKNERNQNK